MMDMSTTTETNLDASAIGTVLDHYAVLVATNDAYVAVMTDDTGEVAWEVVQVAEERGLVLTDDDVDALFDAAHTLRQTMATKALAALRLAVIGIA